jgi:hypothetical protein
MIDQERDACVASYHHGLDSEGLFDVMACGLLLMLYYARIEFSVDCVVKEKEVAHRKAHQGRERVNT